MGFRNIARRVSGLSGVFVLGVMTIIPPAWGQNCNQWSNVPSGVFAGRSRHTLAYDTLRNQMVLFGGWAEDGTKLSDTWTWSDDNGWSFITDSQPSSRIDSAMAFDAGNGVCVLFGGFGNARLNDTWTFDGTTWTQQFPVHSPSPRDSFSMVYDSVRGRVLLFGGYSTQPLNEMWEWDGTDWSLVSATGPTPRYWPGMSYDSVRDRAVLFGGYSSTVDLGDTWEFDGHTATWTQSTPTNSPPARSGMTISFNGTLQRTVMFGGADVNGYKYDTWEWDGTDWTQTQNYEPWGRWRAQSVYDSFSGDTLVYGGAAYANMWYDDIWSYDGTQWYASVEVTPSARNSGRMMYDTQLQTTVLFGGIVTAVENDTWFWDGTFWGLFGFGGPPALALPAMAYDESRQVGILFGGFADTGYTIGETWQWSAKGWTQLAPAHSPSPRSTMNMAYDSDRQVMVMFGGNYLDPFGGVIRYGDTWEWDGTDWNLRATTGPTPRSGQGIAYDRARHRTVLFGGRDDTGRQGDTWTWDGSTWTLASTSGPSARSPYVLEYDRAQQRVVMMGGLDANDVPLSDSWEWNGTSWSAAATGPSARAAQASTYDPVRHVIVLYGGYSPASADLFDVWERSRFPQAGDSDCDSLVALADVSALVQALLDPAGWQSAHSCDYLCANDLNGDGKVDGRDVQVFVQVVTQP